MSKMEPIESVEIAEPAATPRRNRRKVAIMLALPLILAAVGLYAWLTSGQSVSTDNAYVKQDIVGVSTQVNGPVLEVFVHENQHVTRGQPLFRIDPAPSEVALMQAEAQLAAAQLQAQQLGVAAAGTQADIQGAEASLAVAQRALDRQQSLLSKGFTTRSHFDDAYDDVVKARTALADARARSANARAAIAPNGNQPQIASARAAIAKARLDLQHGIVRAPISGTISNADRLLPGQSAITGVTMVSIVRDQAGWVEANFKESDLEKMHPGLKATVKFDAYPGVKLNGHVASIGAGTGSEFSVLPAQNASGNWVKVTQRVPVRIAFDQKPPREMIAGLSADVEVELERR